MSHFQAEHHNILKARAWYRQSYPEPFPSHSFTQIHQRYERRRTIIRNPVKSTHRGSLEIMTTMPLDILYEIFSYLHPQDVLHLSRTTKRLREILMTRNARFVWRAAFSTARGLPQCPADLTEPQYASLAFDEYCHFCSASRVKDVLWTCRVRCCKKCIKLHFITEHELETWTPGLLPNGRPETVFPYIVYPRPSRNTPGRALYYLPTAEAFLSELRALKLAEDENALKVWMKSKKVEQAQRLTHAALCEHWSMYWVYHPSRQYDFDLEIMICALLLLLFYLWKDSIF